MEDSKNCIANKWQDLIKLIIICILIWCVLDHVTGILADKVDMMIELYDKV